MPLFSSREHKSKTWLIILAIVIVLLIIIFVVFGIRNIFRVIIFLGELLLFIVVLMGIAYLFYWLVIKKHRYDVLYVNKKKIIEAGKKCNLQNLKNLYLSGDKGHTRVEIGKIKGYLRLQTVTRKYKYRDEIEPKTGEKIKVIATQKNERGEETQQYELEQLEQDCFIVKNKGLIGIFQEPMIIRTDPEDHDELVGDVTLFGYSIIPIGEYWFLNTDHLDVRKIDYAILQESVRHLSIEIMRDVKSLIDRATGLDAQHKKKIEEKSMLELPEFQKIEPR